MTECEEGKYNIECVFQFKWVHLIYKKIDLSNISIVILYASVLP